MKKWRLLYGVITVLAILVVTLPVCLASQRNSLPVEIKINDGLLQQDIVALVDTNEVLVPVDALMKYINTNVSFDTAEKKVYLYSPQGAFQLETAVLDQRLDQGLTLNFTTQEIKGMYYLNLKGLEKVLGIKLIQDTHRIVIQKENYSSQKLSNIRDKWRPIGKMNLVWDYVNITSQDLSKEAVIAGLDVVSPTWFSIATGDGFVASKADAKYVADAHSKGYKVWALVNNSFDCDMTHQLLFDDRAQERVIKQLLVYSSLYHLDGINLDFENIYDEDKERLTKFVEKLTIALKQQNIIVSMDVTVPSDISFWSNCYDRQKLASIVDYIMVMTYDQYWSKSPISGPVASIGWVETGVKKMLGEVPKEKLLLGVPFYTREWEEKEGSPARSKTMSMAMVEELIKTKNLNVSWLEDKGLHYVEYVKAGQRYRIWIEDEKSMALKIALIDKYDLAGAAAWRKGFERSSIWNVLNTGLKNKGI